MLRSRSTPRDRDGFPSVAPDHRAGRAVPKRHPDPASAGCLPGPVPVWRVPARSALPGSRIGSALARTARGLCRLRLWRVRSPSLWSGTFALAVVLAALLAVLALASGRRVTGLWLALLVLLILSGPRCLPDSGPRCVSRSFWFFCCFCCPCCLCWFSWVLLVLTLLLVPLLFLEGREPSAHEIAVESCVRVFGVQRQRAVVRCHGALPGLDCRRPVLVERGLP